MLHWLMLLGLMNPAALAEEAKREIAETRQEQDQIQRERERAMHLRPVPAAGAPVIVRGAGFYSKRSYLTVAKESSFFSPRLADGMKYGNDIRLSFACSESGMIGTIPAKFKNIQWKIKGEAPVTDIQKGLVQTDEEGLAIIQINSNLKDLEGVSVAVDIDEQKLNIVLGSGPYVFEGLPMSICKLPKATKN